MCAGHALASVSVKNTGRSRSSKRCRCKSHARPSSGLVALTWSASIRSMIVGRASFNGNPSISISTGFKRMMSRISDNSNSPGELEGEIALDHIRDGSVHDERGHIRRSGIGRAAVQREHNSDGVSGLGSGLES